MTTTRTIKASAIREGDTLVEEHQREQRRLRVVHVGPVNGHEYPGGAVLLLMCPVEGGEVRESVTYRRSYYGGEELVVERAGAAAGFDPEVAAAADGIFAAPHYRGARAMAYIDALIAATLEGDHEYMSPEAADAQAAAYAAARC